MADRELLLSKQKAAKQPQLIREKSERKRERKRTHLEVNTFALLRPVGRKEKPKLQRMKEGGVVGRSTEWRETRAEKQQNPIRGQGGPVCSPSWLIHFDFFLVQEDKKKQTNRTIERTGKKKEQGPNENTNKRVTNHGSGECEESTIQGLCTSTLFLVFLGSIPFPSFQLVRYLGPSGPVIQNQGEEEKQASNTRTMLCGIKDVPFVDERVLGYKKKHPPPNLDWHARAPILSKSA